MRILQIVSGPGLNGAILYCLWLTRALKSYGHEVTLLCRPGAWIGVQLKAEGTRVLESDLRRRPAEFRRIAAELRRLEIDVLHTHQSDAHAFGVILRILSRTPCVATAHSTHIQLHWMFNDRVIAVSEAVRRFHRRFNLVANKRIVTVHNFLDHGRLDAIARATGTGVRERLGLDASALLIGYVGKVEPRKGLIFLVEALPRILEAAPAARLLVMGHFDPNDKYVTAIKRRAAELEVAEGILWAGQREDVPQILPALDLFVLPSLREPFGLAALEAMAAGAPVVATRTGGFPEFIDSGNTGILVPKADSRSLANAIIPLLADPQLRQRMGAAAAAQVRQRFTVEQQVPKIEAILAQVAALRPRGPENH